MADNEEAAKLTLINLFYCKCRMWSFLMFTNNYDDAGVR